MNNPATQIDETVSLHCNQLGTGEMWQYWRDHFSHPPLFNDLGCFRTGPDPMGIFDFMMPPFGGKGEGTALLYINRQHPATCGVRIGYTWYPDRVRRRCEFEGLDVETVTRALPDEAGALIRLSITNRSPILRKIEVGIKVAGRLINTIDGWASIGPSIGILDEHPEVWEYDAQLGAMHFTSAEKAFQCQGSRPKPDRVEGKFLNYDIELGAGNTWNLDFVVALGETGEIARNQFEKHISEFDTSNEHVLERWNEKIQKAFQPDNNLYSGHLPTLITENEDLKRLYLQTTLGCLMLRRNNPLSQQGPVFATLSPNYWTTASFLWDMMIASPFYALLDPKVLRTHIEVWLRAGFESGHATDYVTGKPLGNWYAVNSSAIVRLAAAYVRYTGDLAWLETKVGGIAMIDHLQTHALNWHNFDHNGHGLADCGGVINLLECVSTYTHEVAAFNAMWVAALRQVAAMRRMRGETTEAKKLDADASALLKNLMELYTDGEGYWQCKQPDGSLNNIHHIYDFVAVLESIADDLPTKTRNEMAEYFLREHKTNNWTRSLSVHDDDVHRELRVDHQWTGSFVSISAQAMNGLHKIGYGETAYEWLQQVSLVAHQGPIGQAHWVDPLFPSFKGGVWKCSPMVPFMADWVCSANGAYPAMIVESVFGVDATIDKGVGWKGTTPDLEPGSRLENLRCQGQDYTVDKDGLHLID